MSLALWLLAWDTTSAEPLCGLVVTYSDCHSNQSVKVWLCDDCSYPDVGCSEFVVFLSLDSY